MLITNCSSVRGALTVRQGNKAHAMIKSPNAFSLGVQIAIRAIPTIKD